jgi:acyl-coenzyme A synthetase/AMP-(fatty) acid ligase
MGRIIYKSAQGEVRTLEYDHSLTLPSKKSICIDELTEYATDKALLYLALHKTFQEGIVPILYDKNISSIKPRVEALEFNELPKDTATIFFTSGTTGEPTGAIKSKKNLEKELEVLSKLFASEKFERVIVTVPLIHIYGFLAGVLLPRALGAEVVLKEEFLPHELIELSEGKKTLCITNPVFLKVLNKLQIEGKHSHMSFLSSTGKLDVQTAKELPKKLDCNIYQLFGSTETGGIAYKVNDQELWQPLQQVTVAQEEQCLSIDSPFLSKYIIESELKELKHPFVTSDLIELQEGKFRLLGRKSEIIKISGKRISLLEVEQLLEESSFIEEALVKLDYNVESHKDEQLNIVVVSALELKALKKEIKTILQNNYKKINIRSHVKVVEEILKNHMGKKIRR